MATKKYAWHKIAGSEEEIPIAENGIAVIEVNNKKICVAKFQNEWFGFAYTCPHASGLLSQGHIDMLGNVVCPVHRYRFSVLNGRNTSGEGYYLKHWPVKVEEDGIYVGMEEGGFWRW